ncbi:MAG: serine hydrolase [Galbibacter orientalis]|uniref:serine hydrolase domain-containing protein n=1 Tax=Galbibacter orientalis TaxID=453852 RepID=UPI003002F762
MERLYQIIKTYFIILFLLFLSSCKTSNNSTNKNLSKFHREHPDLSSKLEAQVKIIYKEKGLFGDFIFAIVDENGLAYSFTINNTVLSDKKSSFNNDSPIYIASSTKAFTGTLLKILEQKKILSLNKSLNNYLPELNYKDSVDTKKISIKSLLNHTHGTFSTSMAWKTAFLGYSGKNEELIHDLNTDFLYDKSREFRYSNVGPIIAGIVLEKVTGKTWKSEMKNYIFDPLKMKNTSAYVINYHLKNIYPSLTASKERGLIKKGFYKEDITMHAAGGIISTINDLSKWLSANIREDTILLNENSWLDLHNPTTSQNKKYFTYHRTGYSLGWDIAEYQKEKILTRFGNLAGISIHMSFMQKKKIGVIAFSNDNRAYLLPHLMANYAYNLLNELPADSIFLREKLKFDQSFKKENEITYPKNSQLLTENDTINKIVGIYKNTENWPTISIDKKDNYYLFKWGILSGKIYKKEEGGYLCNLGVFTRDFEINNETLSTGSLIYKKVAL